MNEKLLLDDINFMSLTELTDLANKIIDKLKSKGHQITLETQDNAFGFGGAQLIVRATTEPFLVAQNLEKTDMLVASETF